jgi:cobalt/nickel transport system permease protein
MALDNAYYSIGRLDRLSYQDTFIHRLDPRAKVIVTILFILTVVSYPKYEVIALTPFFLFPALLISLGDIPVAFLVKKILIVSPFAIFIGIFNPFFDAGTVQVFGSTFSAGWISFLSILMKFTLTISVALLLIATTSFPGVCHALRRIGLPGLFVSQLLFLYRYLFVLLEEAMRIIRARDMRSFGGRGMDARVAVRIVGALFLRTVERAERIYSAMLSRGFQGDMPTMKQFKLRFVDVAFTLSAILGLALFRFFPIPDILGRYLQRAMP